jgi:ribulose-5-phosphate 4-epimerase/fuculose-1-phosphate aldolase
MADQKRRVSDQEGELRRKLAILCRIVGMQDSIGVYGHISLRVPDSDIVLLTPGAGNRKTRVRTDQIFVFDLAGNILNHPGGDRPLSIPLEWRIHTQIHEDRPEIQCVAHLHAPASTLMGIAGQEITPVFAQAYVIRGGIPTWDNPGLVLNDDDARALSQALGGNVACQMRGHGSVVVGESAETCLQHCLVMEENARFQIAAASLGGVKPFPPSVWERMAEQRRPGFSSAPFVWNYWQQVVEEQGVPL